MTLDVYSGHKAALQQQPKSFQTQVLAFLFIQVA